MLPYFPIQWLIKYVKEFNGFPLCYFLWSCWVWLLGCCSNEGGQSMCVYENNWNEIRIELVWDISDMNIHSFDLPSACTASVIEKLSSPSVRLCKIWILQLFLSLFIFYLDMVTCEESGSFTEDHIDLLQSDQLSRPGGGWGEPLLGAPCAHKQRLLQCS